MHKQNQLPTIGVSSCLLGNPVRYNGDHKKFDWICNDLKNHATLKSFCPEMNMGLGVPRPALRLSTSNAAEIRLIEINSGKDITESAKDFNDKLADSASDLDGFIFKKDSPSCGLERVKVYGHKDMPLKNGVGLFAQKILEKYPYLPTIEEGRLTDLEQCESFVIQLYAYFRFKKVEPKMNSIQNFHQSYKLLIMEKHPMSYHKLGTLVGNQKKLTPNELLDEYKPVFFTALKHSSTPGKRVNVLSHAMGYFKTYLSESEKKHLIKNIEDFRNGLVPFGSPLALIEFLTEKFAVDYLRSQYFFTPYPKTLGIRAKL